MAGKVSVSLTVLFFLFIFAYARTPKDLLAESDVINRDELTELAESDTKAGATILLPSDKDEAEPATVVEIETETETTGSELQQAETTETEPKEGNETETETENETVPLTVVSFRPINRQFPRRPLLPFRHGHRCRHHHRQFKPWRPRFNGHREFSYGKDMILSGGEDVGVDPEYRSKVVREIPARWAGIHHGGSKFNMMHDLEKRMEMKRPRPHHHHHHDGEEEVEKEREEHEHEHKVGFFKRIRKFLNHF